MTTRVVLACDGQVGIHHCRQGIPVGAVATAAEARRTAAKEGWTTRTVSVGEGAALVYDFCDGCTKRAGR